MRTFSELIKTWTPALLLLFAGFLLAWQFVAPAPKSTITISTGQADGAYYRFAQAYRAALAKNGVNLIIEPSAGSAENVARLEAGKADVAFVQGGTIDAGAHDLQALGSLYFEPIWVFSRSPLQRLGSLAGKRIAIGAEGSGTRPVALQLLAANDVNSGNSSLLAESGQQAADALMAGNVDAAFFVAAPSVTYIRTLLRASGIHLMNFARADAYTRRFAYLGSVLLPEGSMDLADNIPADDVHLLATTATLVVRSELHPDLQNILLQAAGAVHRQPGLFESAGEFPSSRFVQLPLSSEAGRYYQYGPPLLQKYLPFWTANLLDRLKIMLLPLVALLLPLIRVMPPIYTWRIRSKIYRWYDDLQRLDLALHAVSDAQEEAKLLAELDKLQRDIRNLHVPLAYAAELYHLRAHCTLVAARKTAASDA